MKLLLLLVRWTCILVTSFTVAFLIIHFGRHTAAYKTHLYRQLLEGNADQKLHAASILASVGAEAELLRALQEDNPDVQSIARRALEHVWFHASGQDAFEMMESAYQAAEREDHQTALRILDQLLRKYPAYAEGWNRRASVLWQMREFEKSQADCERTLKLNPNHYGAWQGLGVCQLQLGDVAAACRSLRAALKITPHDEPTLRSLRQCEELLRTFSRQPRNIKPAEML
jgi:tetratricopeptide (TPR) repeat protein